MFDEPVSIDRVVGANIRQLRHEAGLTQDDLAALLWFFGGERRSHQWVSTRELGVRPTTVADACLIAFAFGVPLTRLLVPYEEAGFTEVTLGLLLHPLLEERSYILDLFSDPQGGSATTGMM